MVAKQQVVDLPLNGRNFTQLLSLTPGVAPVSVSQNSGGFGASVTSGAAIQFPAINGQNNRSNFFLLDGINNQGSLTSTYTVAPIIDTVQEFKVQSHNDQAEFGGALGGIINVVTKSGTNEIHGSAWEFLRNNALDARNPFLTDQDTIPAKPVRCRRWRSYYQEQDVLLWWLAGFQISRRTAEGLFRVPTEANLRGDFSDEPRQLYNPFTTRPNPNGTGFIRDPFPGNIIPQNLIHQAWLPLPVKHCRLLSIRAWRTAMLGTQRHSFRTKTSGRSELTKFWVRKTRFGSATQPLTWTSRVPAVGPHCRI